MQSEQNWVGEGVAKLIWEQPRETQRKFNVNMYEALIKSRTIIKFRHTFFKSVSKRGHVRAKEDVWLPYVRETHLIPTCNTVK